MSDGANSATYSYLANSPLIGQITFQHNGATKMTTTRQYDYLNRLLSISTLPSSSLPQSRAYTYNAANQRTRVKLADSSYWVYRYDSLGQVTSGKKYWSDGTAVAGQQFEYGFDDIGNRTGTKAGGDQSGAGLRPATYSANTLNQYTSRTVPGAVDILGIANAGGTVTVNGKGAYRRNEYFHNALAIDNSAAAVWQSVTVAATGATPQTGHVYLPKTPEDFDDAATPEVNEGYDADGNQVRDGRWRYSWDAENRLIAMESQSAVPDAARMRLEFAYDYRGRRIGKKVFVWNNATLNYQLSIIHRYLYDGWNLIAILDSPSSILQSFLWGLDLSGQTPLLGGTGSGLQGAGGVGGLLAIRPAKGNPLFVAYDGNGNVTGLIDATTGATTARYEYGPFGELIRASGIGTTAKDNPFRFSTKYQDDESDLIYYGFRFYNPSTGRWLSRDPIGEPGFDGNKYYNFTKEDLQSLDALDPEEENLESRQKDNALLRVVGRTPYVMVNNNPIGEFDLYGLVCDTVVNRTKAYIKSSFIKINAGHEWLVYGGDSAGFWPNRGWVLLRPDPAAVGGVPICWQWEAEKKKSGKLKWGSAAGKNCSCATCDQILASLAAAPDPGWHSFSIRNNCRRFTKWALDGSCLKKGKKTSFPCPARSP